MQFLTYTNPGTRLVNEDSLYAENSLYIVCDGVGGNVYGEIASKLACKSISEFITDNAIQIITEEFLNNALKYAINKFRELETEKPELKGMSTTIVLVAFDDAGAKIAWLGDSRCYHIRDGNILFNTIDHSLINDMRKEGITEEIHLRYVRNYITKSISANCAYSFSIHSIRKAEMQNDDFFFLCSDGVLENLKDEKITDIFLFNSSLDKIKDCILEQCRGKTKDNYTFEIIQF